LSRRVDIAWESELDKIEGEREETDGSEVTELIFPEPVPKKKIPRIII
jgi:hypothetical protein